MDVIPYGPAKRLASILMLIHMVISYVITSQVLTRVITGVLFPSFINNSNSSPSINNPNSPNNPNNPDSSSTTVDHTSRLWLPWLGVSLAIMVCAVLAASAVPFFDDLTGIIGALLASNTSFGLPAATLLTAVNLNMMSRLGRLERGLLGFLLVLTLCLMGIGFSSNVVDTIANSQEWGAPFACHELEQPLP